MNNFKIIAVTHKHFDIADIGKFHIDEKEWAARLSDLKIRMGISELMFLSTCNRVEFLLNTSDKADKSFLEKFILSVYPEIKKEELEKTISSSLIFENEKALDHLFNVASSLDSLVVGEREIITQVRTAFDNSKKMNLTGDFIRLVIRQTIETAKKVYTETSIATKPVSVVSLAYHKLKDMNIPLDARIMIVGAGTTNNNMGRFLRKHGFKNFVVFNRTASKAHSLAQDLNGTGFDLKELKSYSNGFDVIITCTGSENHVLTPEIYSKLLQGDTDRKVVIDIALPQDLDPQIVTTQHVTHISVEVLQKISNENLKERSKEIQHVEEIITNALFDFKHVEKVRAVELAMRVVPQQVKEIRNTAVNDVFKSDLELLDDNSREILDKIIGYMEKKYMSGPMILAKEILLKK